MRLRVNARNTAQRHAGQNLDPTRRGYEVYQAKLHHKKFPDPLNVVCILKTHLPTEKKSHVEDSYALRISSRQQRRESF